MKSAKKSSILFVALCSAMLFSCGENHPSSSSNTGNNPSSSMITPTTEVSSTTSLPKDYYGEVEFEGVYIYDNDFDGIQIRPFFTKPEEAKDEVFEYTVKNEDVCFIEDDRIYYQGPGTTIVQAKSEHLKASFAVTAAVANDKNFPYKNSANYKISRAQSMKAEDTLFIGDSFFEFWANKINIDESFNEAFSNYSTLNIGISATTTHDWRVISNKLFENTDVEPKNVVINIGINNVDDDHESGTACARNIQSLIQDYLDAYENTNIYYFSITRCSGTFSYLWEKHAKSNSAMKEYCETQERVHYLDVMSLYGDNYAQYEQDGLHPNQEGYNLFKKLILENVQMSAKN